MKISRKLPTGLESAIASRPGLAGGRRWRCQPPSNRARNARWNGQDGLLCGLSAASAETLRESAEEMLKAHPDAFEHGSRVGVMAGHLARLLGHCEVESLQISQAAVFHDLGKLGVAEELLAKPGALTSLEKRLVERHTVIGASLLSGTGDEILSLASAIALSHHERFDGTGYPHGLAGEKIPYAAQIVGLVDQYDALRSQREYRSSLSHSEAAATLLVGDGRTLTRHFNPEILAAFRSSAARFDTLYRFCVDANITGRLVS